jgi:hypothetical protein
MTASTASPITNARSAVRGLLNGNPPNGIAPDTCGPYAALVATLYQAHEAGGTQAVVGAFNVAARVDKAVAQLVSGDNPPPAPTLAVPALPAEATAIYAHAAPCGAWLDDYVAFAQQAAPMTPRLLHEAAGLFAVSAAVARRLVVKAGLLSIYPNLYFLFVSPSTIDHKSTGLRVLEQVIQQAGLSHLMMPRKGTPQALVMDLDHHKLPNERQMRDLPAFLARRAFAAQRAWIREEASALFASLKQEFNAGLLELILELYDCPESYDDLTVSRGETRIERAYLSFFGVSTPSEMQPHFANQAFWTNGLWARCLVLTPRERAGAFVFFPSPMDCGPVAAGLREIAGMFPSPVAELNEVEDINGNKKPFVQLHDVPMPRHVLLAEGVWDAWEAYSRATGHTLIYGGAVDEELYACYGRFGTLAIKVATLLATMDAPQLPVSIELRHFARAQQLVEGWRAGLHTVFADQGQTLDGRLADRALKQIRKAGAAGVTARDLCRALRAHTKDVSECLAVLEKAGKVECRTVSNSRNRKVELWVAE